MRDRGLEVDATSDDQSVYYKCVTRKSMLDLQGSRAVTFGSTRVGARHWNGTHTPVQHTNESSP